MTSAAGQTPPSLHLDLDDLAARKGFIAGLDGMRALSISIVLIGHLFLPEGMTGLSALGVYMFFVISGFLITRLLIAEYKMRGSIDIKDFFIRRLLRLYPVLIVFAIVICLLSYLNGKTVPGIEVLSVFAYFTNYLMAARELTHEPTVLPISILWSLSVEEHFYLFMPLVALLVKADPRKLIIIAVGVIIASFALRTAYVIAWPEIRGTNFNYLRSETRFDSIAWGVLLAGLFELPQAGRIVKFLTSPAVIAAALVMIVGSYAIRDPIAKDTIRFVLRSASMLPLICAAICGTSYALFKRFLNHQAMTWIGRLSYSLYIWHGAAGSVRELLGISVYTPLTHGLLYSSLALVMAILSYYGVERPFLRLKRKAHAPVAGGRPPESVPSGFVSATPLEKPAS